MVSLLFAVTATPRKPATVFGVTTLMPVTDAASPGGWSPWRRMLWARSAPAVAASSVIGVWTAPLQVLPDGSAWQAVAASSNECGPVTMAAGGF